MKAEKSSDAMRYEVQLKELREENRRLQDLVTSSEEQVTARVTQDMVQRFREFAQAMPDFSMILAEQGRVLEIFGPKQAWLTGRQETDGEMSLENLMPEESVRWLLERSAAALNGDGVQQGEVSLVLGGVMRTLALRVAAMSYTMAGQRTVAVTFQDVTDRIRLRKMVQNAYDRRRRSEFFRELLQGRYKAESDLYAQCWRLGIDAQRTFIPIVGKIVQLPEGKTHTASELEQQLLLEEIVEALTAGQEDWISWTNGDTIGLLYYGESSEAAQASLLTLESRLKGQFEGVLLAWGISECLNGLLQLPSQYEQAHAAAIFNRQYQVGGITHYQELGMDQILLSLQDSEIKRAFIQRQLGPLLEYDERKGTELVGTLAEILRNGNLKLVADHLFLHHKTVVFRKKRIEELLKCSLDSFETRMALVTALKLLRLADPGKK
ncbi:helix-turn-helix domain-containing protein [Azotosporobacter soli]|uniref:helix-turn-helix domain-containing protein n=1 Tax=Azotosporobacter soli TaxID=3055040 RepID=UPI0031FE9529